jgi:hypothetical protein
MIMVCYTIVFKAQDCSLMDPRFHHQQTNHNICPGSIHTVYTSGRLLGHHFMPKPAAVLLLYVRFAVQSTGCQTTRH